MQLLLRWFWVLPALFLAGMAQAAKTDVRLLLESETVRPGSTVMAGIHMHMAPRWHTYWRNSGDSGGATTVEWDLPAGITAGAIQWPVPEKYDTAGLITYVYHDDAVLLVPLTVSPSVAAGPVEISAKVSWLECAEQCVKGRGTVKKSFQVGPVEKKSSDAALIGESKNKLPEVKTDIGAQAYWEKADAESRNLVIEWNLVNGGADPDFYPLESKGYEVGQATEKLSASSGKAKIRKVVKKFEGDWPTQVAGLLVEKNGGAVRVYQVQMPILDGAGRAAAGPSGIMMPRSEALPSFWGALGLAFLGGLILNVMPCVLPVIALKILGFVQQSHESTREVRRLGLIYVGGVLFSFLLLALAAIGLQKAGHNATWGSQFQDPRFVVVIATLMTLVALNLFGVFEVTLPGSALGAASDLSSKHGASGAFFNGFLATALATSCTAPILAAALGYALATPQPAHIIILMFLMLGIGMAAPYLVLSWYPALLRFLPKPGAWMEKFKMAMGFPMLATALWLLARTADHFGDRGPLWVGLFLLLVSFAAWVWGEFGQRSTARRGVAVIVCLLLLGTGYGYCLEKELGWRTRQQVVRGNHKSSPDGIDWQPWSQAAVEKAQAEGRAVLVDFTANWCLTCQAGKRYGLEVPAVRSKIKETNTVALIADFTGEDPLIAAELKRFNQAGVPLLLVFPKDPKREPIVLPPWPKLRPSLVVSALDEATK